MTSPRALPTTSAFDTIDALKQSLNITPINTGRQIISRIGLVSDDLERLHAYEQDGEIMLASGVEMAPYLFRGQTKEYAKCAPSLNRLKTVESRLIALCRNAAFEAAIRAHPYVSFCANQRIFGLPLRIDTQGLAQHYGMHTDMLDVTNSFDIASFFSTNYWSDTRKCYEPVTDENLVGVIYSAPIFMMAKTPSRLSMIGWQPLRRPEQQRAAAVTLKQGEDFTRFPYVQRAFFKQNATISRRIWDQYDGGKALFPSDEAAQLAEHAGNLLQFTDDEIARAWQRLTYWEFKPYLPKQRQEVERLANIQRVERPALSWANVDAIKDPVMLQKRFHEEMSRVRIRLVGDHISSRDICRG